MDDLARRSVPAEPSRDTGAYLVSCSLVLDVEIQEKPCTVGGASPWKEHEATGRRSGTFEAVIANCVTDPYELVSKPSVFEWPDQRLFIAMQVTHVDQEFSAGAAEHWRTTNTHLFAHPATRTHVRGVVLGIARYGDTRIAEPEARRRLGLAPKSLNP